MNKKNDLILFIILPLGALVIAFITNKMQETIKLELFLYAIVLIFASLSIALLYNYFWENGELKNINLRISSLELTVDKYASQNNVPSLYTVEQVVSYEQRINADEIWLISEDLAEELEDGPFSDIVSNNLKRGTKYVYFAPNLPHIGARFETIKNHHNSKLISIVYLPTSFFFLTDTLDITIFNPLSQSKKRSGFLGLPLADDDKEHYHIFIDNSFIDKIVGALLENYKSKIM